MTGDREENSIEADDPDVEIHEAILARERAGGSLPDADTLAAMEEPLHRLTSAAVLFSHVTTKKHRRAGAPYAPFLNRRFRPMINANPVTNDSRNPQTTVPAIAARAAAGRPKLAAVRLYSPPDADRPATAADWQVREEPEYYIPDLLSDRDYSPDPALIDAAEAHTEVQREAMALLDDAENLLAVLLASQEQECDSRAMQAEAVLKIVRKKLNKAHVRIDRQESSHRNVVLAYFELKERAEAGGE